jgi:hypothetical protein
MAQCRLRIGKDLLRLLPGRHAPGGNGRAGCRGEGLGRCLHAITTRRRRRVHTASAW